MFYVALEDEEAVLLREMLDHAYRSQHREYWEVSHFGEASVLASTASRLKALEVLLIKLGGAPNEVNR